MALADFQHATTEIPLPRGNSFTIRGLTLEDISVLIQNHIETITQAAVLYKKTKTDIVSSASLQGFLLTLARDFPGLSMEVISVAADEPSAKQIKLPAAIQIAALTEIVRLTITDAGGMGNLFAVLVSALEGVVSGKALEPLKAAVSQSFIGDSAKT